MHYRKGNKHLPEEFVSHVKWEQAWMTSVMERGGKDMPPLSTETITHSLFNPSETNRVVEVHAPATSASQVRDHRLQALFDNLRWLH